MGEVVTVTTAVLLHSALWRMAACARHAYNAEKRKAFILEV